MAKTLIDQLKSLNFSPFQQEKVRKQLRLQEKGISYVLELKPAMNSCAFQIDGYIIKSAETDKCDFVALVRHEESWAELYVELKGSDIAHAIKQIETTITSPIFKNTVRSLRRARVVTANRIPANTGNSIIEKAKVNFKKMGCDFRTIKSLQPDVLKMEDFRPASI